MNPPAASEELNRIVEAEWEFRLRDDPLTASRFGDHRYDAALPSLTVDACAARAATHREFLDRVESVSRTELRDEERVHAEVLARELRDRIADHEFGAERLPWNAEGGFHSHFACLPDETRFQTVEDLDHYLARLRAFRRYAGEQIEWLRRGLESGCTVPKVALANFGHTLAVHACASIESSVFFTPLRTLNGDRRAEGRAAVLDVIGVYRVLLAFFEEEYLPGARETLGASELPRGREWYEHLVRSFTTLDLTPEEVHAVGRAEVARITSEMEIVKAKVGFTGDLAAFIESLRNNRRFVPASAEHLLREAAWLCKRIDGQLPAFFGRLPRLPYGVEPVPAHLAPGYTGGRYVEPPADGRRAGIYWVNTFSLENRLLYLLPALTLHEAVPGHHLQIALHLEMDELPPFRRVASPTAYVEGWALYAEHLGIEMGLYEDPQDDFGRLSYEMWRACRLVIDTGLHAFGWTREAAQEYLASHTALSRHEVGTEVDRYISWPGQALAYKIGELEIRRLRRLAEERLGARFDLRAFHDELLAHGALPLDILRRQIETFLARNG